MKDKVTLETIMGDFNPNAPTGHVDGGTVTVWLNEEYKAKYDRLQKLSRRKFAKKIRELVQAAIDMAEKRAG